MTATQPPTLPPTLPPPHPLGTAVARFKTEPPAPQRSGPLLPQAAASHCAAGQALRFESDSTPLSGRVPNGVRVALLALILAAFALRTARLGFQSLWRDEVDAIYFALRPIAETLSMITAAAQNGPLYFLSLRPWLSIVGSSEYALRLPSALAAVAAVPLLWQVARRLLGGAGAGGAAGAPLIAAVLLVANPYAQWYGQEGKMYAAVVLLSLLATWFWLRGVERGGAWPWIGYAASVSLAMYTHLLMVLLIPVHFLWFLIVLPSMRHTAKGRERGYLAALAALILPYLPMVAWHWDMLTATQKLTGFNHAPLTHMVRTVLLNQARGYAPGENHLLLAPYFFLVLLGLLLGWSELRPPPAALPRFDTAPRPRLLLAAWQRFAILLLWALGPLLAIWLVSLRQPVFTDRYIIWSLPALLMLAALGLEVVRRNLGRAGVPVAATLLLLVAGIWLHFIRLQSTTIIKYDLRAAVRTVAANRSPDDLLLLQIPHIEWSYRYYSSDQGVDPFAGSDERLGRWAGGGWTNNGLPDSQAAAEIDTLMRTLTAGADEIWLLLSEAEMWDNRRLMDEWLARNTDRLEDFSWQGAAVAHLRLRLPLSP